MVPGGTAPCCGPGVNLERGQVWPCPVDLHTHLDKGHIWPRQENPDGTFMGALHAVARDREANWSAGDVAARMEFGLKCSYAHGTSAVRTHLDSVGKQAEISWPVFAEMRERWAGRITLQAACLVPPEIYLSDEGERIASLVARHGGVLGCVTYMIPRLDEALDRMFALATKHGLDVDFHVDETGDPEAVSLRRIAEAALRNRFEGRILCGHCCSLAMQEPGSGVPHPRPCRGGRDRRRHAAHVQPLPSGPGAGPDAALARRDAGPRDAGARHSGGCRLRQLP